MDYLVYVEHDAENLQFYLWLQDYTKRFEEDLKPEEQKLSPEWSPEKFQTQGPDKHEFPGEKADASIHEVITFPDPDDVASRAGDRESTFSGFTGKLSQVSASSGKPAGMKWQPCKSL
jgi:hypothetical protein